MVEQSHPPTDQRNATGGVALDVSDQSDRETSFDGLVDVVIAQLQARGSVAPSVWEEAPAAHRERIGRLLPTLQALAGLAGQRAPANGHANGAPHAASPSDAKKSAHSSTHSHAGADAETPPSLNGVRHAVDGGRYFARQLQGFLDAPQRADEIGRLAEYRVLSVLGAGGAGIVLRAEDEALRREVAIKVLSPPLAALPATRARFRREAQAMAAIDNEHVVSVHRVGEHYPGHDAGEAAGLPYLVMPLLVGETLRARLEREGALPVAEVLRIGREIATALAAAHERGLLHRDIKPDNIWLDNMGHGAPNGRVRVLDFGLAHSVADDGLTLTGTVLGTPRYMSPEQARGEEIDARSDLFSLGTLLYQAASGQCPFEGKSYHGVLRQICDHAPPPLPQMEQSLPAGVSALVQRLLEKSPDLRLASAGDVVAEIRRLEADGIAMAAAPRPATTCAATSASASPLTPTLSPVGRGSHSVPWLSRRRPWLYAALALTIAVVSVPYLLRSGGIWPSSGRIAVAATPNDGGEIRSDVPKGDLPGDNVPSGSQSGALFLFAVTGGKDGVQPLEALYGIVVNEAGDRITVSEQGPQRIRVFDGQGREQQLFGGAACAPRGMVTNARGETFVCDQFKARVFVFASDGAFIRSFGKPSGGAGFQPEALAIGKKGLLYVTDVGSHCVDVFHPSGHLKFSFGRQGKSDGQFHAPVGIATDENGDVYVADYFNHRVQVFAADGTWKKTLGKFGHGIGELSQPRGVTVDRAGRVYVSDSENHRIQVFDREGNVALVFDGAESSAGLLKQPNGLALDGNGRLYVVDTGNNRVVVFRLPWTAAEGAAQVPLADWAKGAREGQPWDFTEGAVTLRAHTGRYLQAHGGGGIIGCALAADAEKVNPNAVFQAVEFSPGQWALLCRNGYWLRAEDGGGKDKFVSPDAQRIGTDEVFTCEARGDHVAFRTRKGFYLRPHHGDGKDKVLSADADRVGPEELFYCERK